MSIQKERLGRSFAALNLTQFLGALNDNVFKLLLIYVLVDTLEPTGATRAQIVSTISAIFVLPFLLFSHAAGVLADRVSKRRIIVFTKGLEIALMAAGCAAIGLREPSLMYAVLFGMCTQSAIFGPSKYGIIPEVVGDAQISRANSLLVGMSYLAIIIGTFLPTGLVVNAWPGNYVAAGLVCVGISLLGLTASLGIHPTPPAGSQKKLSLLFVSEIFRTLKSLRTNRDLSTAIYAAAYFLFLAAFIQQTVLLYAPAHLGLPIDRSGYFFPVAALGIGLGAILAGRLSGRNIEFGIVPVGAAILTLSCLLLGSLSPTPAVLAGALFFLGLGAGLFIVPLIAFVQFASPDNQRGEIVACQSFLSFLGAALSAGLVWLLNDAAGLSPAACFTVVGLLTAALTVVSILILPDFLVRLAVVLLTRIVYRLDIHGVQNVPVRGGALIVPNHVSYVDALLLCAALQRRIRFVMIRRIYENRWLNPLFRLMGVIPISPDDPPREVAKSLRAAGEALQQGFLVCIFAEGSLTLTGQIQPFRPGLEHIAKNAGCPVIPAYLGGVWGSIFSMYHGKLLGAWPRTVPYPASVIFGEPLPGTARPEEVRQAVLQLSADYFDFKKAPGRNLPETFISTARKLWRRNAMSDTLGKRVTFGRTLTGAVLLSGEIDRLAPGQEKVGVILPPSVGGALVNAAITLTGRVPVNLNFTASPEAVDYAIRISEIRTIISSRAFLEKLEHFERRPGTVDLEDIMGGLTTGKKLSALLKARLAPARMLMTWRRPDPDDLATVIFSSGSTGVPKGVMLTHHNIISNIESFSPIFRFNGDDRICACLPFFHSFGFTATLWSPLTMGFASHFHPNPMDGAKITEIVREEKLTILMTTPTFLLAYIRKGTREDFRSLRGVVTGAEKLKTKVADAFEARFGIRPREGYGTTELSPVVGVNVDDAEGPAGIQVGNKDGSIGRPIPGVSIRITDPDSGALLGTGQEGLVWVHGPNVMKGYLNEPEKTAEVLVDGWYNTGDIGRLDEDGFLFLTDRLSRFSKIGGEMVPHLAVEERLLEALGSVHHVLAVTGVPDERKGEQLVLLHTPEAGNADSLRELIDACDIPNLWKPRRENIIEIAAIPTLGSGKLDLKGIRQAALDHKGL